MLDPDRPDFAGGNGHRTLPFDAGNEPHEVGNRLLRAQRGLVADHDCIDVVVAARQRDRRLDLAFVAGLVLVDPDAERHLQAELGGDARHQLAAARGAVGADGVGVGAEKLQVGANLIGRRAIAVIGML